MADQAPSAVAAGAVDAADPLAGQPAAAPQTAIIPLPEVSGREDMRQQTKLINHVINRVLLRMDSSLEFQTKVRSSLNKLGRAGVSKFFGGGAYLHLRHIFSADDVPAMLGVMEELVAGYHQP